MWDVLTMEEKNKVVLKLLVHMSSVDHAMNEDEFLYLVHFCKSSGIDISLVREYLTLDTDLKEILPSSEEERMNILYHLLFTMNADNHIHEDEEKMIYTLALRLGYSEGMTREFIDVMKNHTLDTIPLESLLDILRKYNN